MNILQMSISAGILVLIVVVIRAFAMNRLPKTMFIALWGIALFRLIIPFSIPSKFSIYNLINHFKEAIALKAGVENGNWDALVLINRSTGYMSAVDKPLQIEAILLIWIIGTAILALFFSVSFYKSYREIRTALPIKGNAIIDKWLRGQRIYRSIKILVSDKITTPLTYGIIKPKIILPKSMHYSNEMQMKYILAHEFIHIKRFDALWKLLLVLALCIHWFNPTVWALYVLMNRDLEIACDEKVIKLFGENTKSDYALSLIEMVECRTKFTPLYSSFSKNATEERIVSIMKFKKASVFSLVLALILVAGATLVFAESAADTVLRVYGVIQTDSGRFNFDIDKKGMITVKDADGKVVSTSTVGADGKAVLTDGAGNIIKTLYLDIPEQIEGKILKIYRTDIQYVEGETNFKYGIIKDTDMLPKFFTTFVGKGIFTLKDAEGKVISTKIADNQGPALLIYNKGDAILKDSMVMKLNLSLKNNEIFQ